MARISFCLAATAIAASWCGHATAMRVEPWNETEVDAGDAELRDEGAPPELNRRPIAEGRLAGIGGGDATAKWHFVFGRMYETGTGFPQSDAEAAKWYRISAEQGFSLAQFRLGWMYANGRGVDQDYAQAAKWFRQAANQRLPAAQTWLGVMYREGRGVDRDHAQALHWLRKAAGQGYEDAQVNLGRMYAHGLGVPQNDVEAAFWCRKAAEKDFAWGQLELGVMYEEGRGDRGGRLSRAAPAGVR